MVATNQLTGTLPEDLVKKFGHLFPDHNSFFGILLSTAKLHDSKIHVSAACIGGGQGIAVVLEQV